MLAMRLRVRPCSARCSPRSVGRFTSTTRSPSESDSSTVSSCDTRSSGTARVVAGHDTARGRDDRRPHPAQDLRDLPRVHVGAAAGARDALEAGDDGAAVLGVLEADADDLADPRRLDLVAVDVALLAQDPGELDLESRC